MSNLGYAKKTVDVDERQFLVQVLKFYNGNIITVTEGEEKIGSIVASIGNSPSPATVTVIPSKTDSLFVKLAAQRISTTIKGISIVSISTQKELGIESAKVLINEIMELIRT